MHNKLSRCLKINIKDLISDIKIGLSEGLKKLPD